MPLALLVIGTLFLTAAVRGKQDLLFDTLKDDFTGPNNFLYWGLSIFIVTSAGYYKPLRPLSNAFLVLIVIVLFLAHRGFIEQFMAELGATQRSSLSGVHDDAGLATRLRADHLVSQGVNLAKSIFGV